MIPALLSRRDGRVKPLLDVAGDFLVPVLELFGPAAPVSNAGRRVLAGVWDGGVLACANETCTAMASYNSGCLLATRTSNASSWSRSNPASSDSSDGCASTARGSRTQATNVATM